MKHKPAHFRRLLATTVLALALNFFTGNSLPASAAGMPESSGAPVEISALKSLEWNRTAKTYTARNDVIVKQGQLQITCDTLTALYRDGTADGKKSVSEKYLGKKPAANAASEGGTDIYKMLAVGHVVIQSPPYTAYGDNATYDVEGNAAQLTGGNLRIETPTDKLTAQKSIEFFGRDNRLNAVGGAVATRGTDTLAAENLSAFFAQGPDGKTALNHMTADGNVSIKTQKDTVFGDHGTYDVAGQKAVLTGKVKIFQGENWLEGTRAEVNLVTGVSQLFGTGNVATEGRVKGIFYPKGKAAAEAAAKAAAADADAPVPLPVVQIKKPAAPAPAMVAPAPVATGSAIISAPPAMPKPALPLPAAAPASAGVAPAVSAPISTPAAETPAPLPAPGEEPAETPRKRQTYEVNQ
ncbi:MAG: LptA/OstA family protein [Micavibrio sp.]|nr:LptA/OstA family protein [Micavibrio sp.]